jgi:hypothetical protein
MATPTAVRTARATGSGSVAASKIFTPADITTKSPALPNRYAFHAAPGFGKTSILAFSNAPIFLMTRGEDGLKSLIASGQLPETPQ